MSIFFQIVGNKNPAFLEQRREQLEQYLKELLLLFRIQLPRVLAEFLDFNKYDIIYLLQDLAKLCNENGDALLSANKEFNFSALEVRYSNQNEKSIDLLEYLKYLTSRYTP